MRRLIPLCLIALLFTSCYKFKIDDSRELIELAHDSAIPFVPADSLHKYLTPEQLADTSGWRYKIIDNVPKSAGAYILLRSKRSNVEQHILSMQMYYSKEYDSVDSAHDFAWHDDMNHHYYSGSITYNYHIHSDQEQGSLSLNYDGRVFNRSFVYQWYSTSARFLKHKKGPSLSGAAEKAADLNDIIQ